MIPTSSFGASRASRLDAILQKKNRTPTFEKRELLKKKTVTASLTISTAAESIKPITTNSKSDDAQRVKQSASSDALEIETPKWNSEDQELINFVIQNWNEAFFKNPAETWERLHYEIAQGPEGIEAKRGSLQNALRFLKEEFEKLNNQKKDVQIQTKTQDSNHSKVIEPCDDPLFNAGQNLTWSNDDQELIDWFLIKFKNKQLPQPPFLLSPGVTVMNAKFYDRITLEIEAGANSPRARMGTLQFDLGHLKKIMPY